MVFYTTLSSVRRPAVISWFITSLGEKSATDLSEIYLLIFRLFSLFCAVIKGDCICYALIYSVVRSRVKRERFLYFKEADMFTTDMAISMLKEKCAELGRLPKKDDFSSADIARIKSRLGPWNRALEKAGLKEKKQKKSSKRIKE